MSAFPSLLENVVDRLEKELGTTLKGGRMHFWGLPVDVNEKDSDGDGIVVQGVDQAATREMMKKLRQKGFKTRFLKDGRLAGSVVIEGVETASTFPTFKRAQVQEMRQRLHTESDWGPHHDNLYQRAVKAGVDDMVERYFKELGPMVKSAKFKERLVQMILKDPELYTHARG